MASTDRRRFDVTFNDGTYSTVEAEDSEHAKQLATRIVLAGKLGSMDEACAKIGAGYEPPIFAVKAEVLHLH